MAGRRVVDAAKLLGAAREVAQKHVTLRSQQLDVYNKTSTLAQAVKQQTDRVTLTARAAAELGRRLNSDPPFRHTEASSRQPHHDDIHPQAQDVSGRHTGHPEGLAQDHHYRQSMENAAEEPPATDSFDPRQEQAERYPFADGTIPPAHAPIGASVDEGVYDTLQHRPYSEPPKHPLSASEGEQHPSLHPRESDRSSILMPETATSKLSPDEARKLQRQYEDQIPALSAKEEPEDISGLLLEAQDSFYDPPRSASPEYSSLPRVKLPKHVEAVQGGDEHVHDEQINQDVYYTPRGGHAANEGESDLPQDVNTDIFHNPRLSQLLGGPKKKTQKIPGLNVPEKSEQIQTTGLHSSNRPSKPHPLDDRYKKPSHSTTTFSSGTESEADTRRLAQELAEDMRQDKSKTAETTNNSSNSLNDSQQESSTTEKYRMRESRVPSSRFGRMWEYAGLGTGMAFGAVGEGFRRIAGAGSSSSSWMLSSGNMERLVAKLSRMRGAALKLGQMISFQDIKMLPAPIHEVLQRVQDSADYMPPSQRNAVMASNLGNDWHDLFESFDETPIAAASIGQVHRARLRGSGQDVAVKVQYPGVAQSIDSDLNNLSILLTASRLLPKGLYLDKTIANARTELAWECDYVREAECATRYHELLADDTDTFTVPRIISEACGPQVLTAEFMHGTAATKLQATLSQDQRDWIGSEILRLCLRELTEFAFMQTDPNWTNFLYNRSTNKIELLDFGASREFPASFVDPYVQVLLAASQGDRETVRRLSVQLGYLTGSESRTMSEAHVDSVLTLAEPFSQNGPELYDFRDQTITDRVRELIPVMLRERLAPPPEETYSLHRKLSGAFLLCARLGSRVQCRELFQGAVGRWQAKRS